MSSLESNDNQRALYLEHIKIETAVKNDFRVVLQIDDRDVEIQRDRRTSIWTPFRSLKIPDASEITLFIKKGRLALRNREAQVEISSQEAMDAFWTSTDMISRAVTLDQRTAIVTFNFRPSPNWESTRAAVQQLESAMETYHGLMGDSTERAIDLVFTHGAMNPVVSAAFSIAKSVFEVLKEQKKYDGMVSGLADGIGRITPFAKLVLEETICDETELLRRAVTKMCSLIMDTGSQSSNAFLRSAHPRFRLVLVNKLFLSEQIVEKH